MLEVGKRLPDATLLRFGSGGPEQVRLPDLLNGRKVVIFAVPGAFTPTCDSSHMPSFVANADAIRAKGVDAILCVSVNDVHVMRYWGETTGATKAGIECLADADASFTRAAGMLYENPSAGMFERSRRYALIAEDGVVTHLNLDEIGVCSLSKADPVLELL